MQGLGFEMDIDVSKGYTWDGVMQVCALAAGVHFDKHFSLLQQKAPCSLL